MSFTAPELRGPHTFTLGRFIMEQERRHPGASGEFSSLLLDFTLAAKIITREVTKAGLVNILGFTGTENVHGEKVQKLDVFAHDIIYRSLDHTGQLCALTSEEEEGILHIPAQYPCGKYVLNYDPLDGSSNIDANGAIGSIFSVHRRVTASGRGTEADVLQPGSRQVAAGYVLWGASVMLVYTDRHGVHGFTYDPSVGEFLLSHENIRTPERGAIYSCNEGNYNAWEDGVRRYVDYLKGDTNANGRPYSGRYVGSLVADFHRNLLYGGIYLYPGDRKNPDGKLRLLYEASPLALVLEQAGGAASDGRQRILDIQPQRLHQRTPLVLGSPRDVEEAQAFIGGRK
ncbi:MAG TPA: class 1 fructose-bisphosphatase [Candidatus Saccharimonadales bacterium]|nr:class 1 fructose-bisphosphatase [Candidatus Saccharimonadales bacterium]